MQCKISPTAVLAESWIIVKHRSGEWKPLWPKYQGSLPMCGSSEEAYGRLRILLAQRPELLKRWDGWSFVAVRFDDQMRIDEGRVKRGEEL